MAKKMTKKKDEDVPTGAVAADGSLPTGSVGDNPVNAVVSQGERRTDGDGVGHDGEPFEFEKSQRPLTVDSEVGPTPGSDEHTAAGGTYPGVDKPEYVEEPPYASAWPNPQSMLKSLEIHMKETHGLAVDKAMFERLHGYLTYHLKEAGFTE